jgi:hypothetical protein
MNIGIHDISKLTGVGMATLRVWEQRYGWPVPPRDENNYRSYPSSMVKDIKRVKNLIDTGVPVSEIIKDGQLFFPVKLVPKPKKPKYDFKKFPQPTSKDGKDLRALIEDAILVGNWGKVEELKAQVLRLHPKDRPGILDLLKSINR